MNKNAVRALALAASGMVAANAQGQAITVTPLVDLRLRLEHVDQGGIANGAEAVTLRVRPGVQAKKGPFSVLVEAEGMIGIVNHYNDGFNSRALPVVPDAQNVELNRAQIRYAGKTLAVTAGRQRIELADQRFVGSSPWRQNEATFDAVRVQWTGIKGVSVDATHAWSVRTVNGIQGTLARPLSIDGHNWFGVVGYTRPVGTLSGFAYLIDQDSAALSGYRLSSQTYGARFQGSRPLSKTIKLNYIASVARQSDYAKNPNDFAATYWLGEATLAGKVLTGTLGYEVLGADQGAALTSVQTPLASYFRVQGWAGKFTTTPPDGVRDAYATLSAGWKGRRITSYGVGATFHRFDSDRLAMHYGNELDVVAQARIKRYGFAVRYARYSADRFATNTSKLFAQVDWAF